MKVNIKKDGQAQEFELINDWSDVSLEKWAQLVASQKAAKGKADVAIASITHLSDMPEKLLKELSLKDVANLMGKLAVVQSMAKSELVNKITINDIEYGFHPDLEEITLGEYADLEHCIQDGLQDNMHKVMAVLYRPILETKGNWYSIEPYDVESKRVREQIFKEMKAAEVESALLFFWTFVRELLKLLPLFLTEKLKAVTS